jgi:biotin carboxylase
MSRVVIIEPRSSGCWLIDKAAERGDEAIVLTAGHGGRRVPDVHLDHADYVELVDTNDDDAVLAAVRRLHDAEPVHAVVPGFEHYVPLAARVAAALGLPGLDPQAALRLRHKHLMRAALATAGVDQPAWAVVADERDLVDALQRTELPCVVKPVDLSGSLHVRKSATLEEASAALHAARGRRDPDLDWRSLPLVLVEEFVAGPEYSVEGFVQDGRVHVLSITKKLLADEPFFVEIGHIVPGDLSRADSRPVELYVRRVAGALGLSLGVFHAEVRLSSRGPLLIEIAARMGGDNIPQLLELSRGVDLYDITLRCHLGLPVTAEPRSSNGTRAGVRYFLRPRLDRYTDVWFADGVRADPRVRDLQMLIPPGAQLPRPGSSRARLGYAVVTGASYEAVRSLLDDVDRGTTFHSEPDS